MKPAHLGWNAFFVTLFGTVVYGAVVGLVAAGPIGAFLGAMIAAFPSMVVAFPAACAYRVLGVVIDRRAVGASRGRLLSIGLGVVLGPMLALTSFAIGGLAIGAQGLPGPAAMTLGAVAVVVGGFGGWAVWSCAVSHARTVTDPLERR